MKILASAIALTIALLVASPAKAEKMDGSKIAALKVDGHRVKSLKAKIKARRAKVKPKTPDVAPAPSKPEKKPGVKDHQFSGRLRDRLFGRRHRPSPDSGPSDHPSLKPVPSEKLPLPKPSKVPGVQDKPKPKS